MDYRISAKKDAALLTKVEDGAPGITSIFGHTHGLSGKTNFISAFCQPKIFSPHKYRNGVFIDLRNVRNEEDLSNLLSPLDKYLITNAEDNKKISKLINDLSGKPMDENGFAKLHDELTAAAESSSSSSLCVYEGIKTNSQNMKYEGNNSHYSDSGISLFYNNEAQTYAYSINDKEKLDKFCNEKSLNKDLIMANDKTELPLESRWKATTNIKSFGEGFVELVERAIDENNVTYDNPTASGTNQEAQNIAYTIPGVKTYRYKSSFLGIQGYTYYCYTIENYGQFKDYYILNNKDLTFEEVQTQLTQIVAGQNFWYHTPGKISDNTSSSASGGFLSSIISKSSDFEIGQLPLPFLKKIIEIKENNTKSKHMSEYVTEVSSKNKETKNYVPETSKQYVINPNRQFKPEYGFKNSSNNDAYSKKFKDYKSYKPKNLNELCTNFKSDIGPEDREMAEPLKEEFKKLAKGYLTDDEKSWLEFLENTNENINEVLSRKTQSGLQNIWSKSNSFIRLYEENRKSKEKNKRAKDVKAQNTYNSMVNKEKMELQHDIHQRLINKITPILQEKENDEQNALFLRNQNKLENSAFYNNYINIINKTVEIEECFQCNGVDANPSIREAADSNLGKLKIEKAKFLGAGANASTYAVKFTGSDRIYAIKIGNTDIDLVIGKDITEKLPYNHSYCRYWAKGKINDIGEDIVIFEYCEGTSLTEYQEKFLKQNTEVDVKESRLKKIARELLLSLESLTVQGEIIHRDMKPDNIMVSYDEESGEISSLKIIDLGGSRTVPEFSNIGINLKMTIMGTPVYMAPEISAKEISKKKRVVLYDSRIDVFSVGCTLYGLLFGSDELETAYKRGKGIDTQKMISNIESSEYSKEAKKFLISLLLDPSPQAKIDNNIMTTDKDVVGIEETPARPTVEVALHDEWFN